MAIKDKLNFRVYIFFILLIIIFIVITSRVVYIQQFEGSYWKAMSDSLHVKVLDIVADRGNIFSQDGELLSSSVPEYDLYLDCRVEYLHQKNGVHFWQNLDSLSHQLSGLFKDRAAYQYRQLLVQGYKHKSNLIKLQQKVNYHDFQALKQFSFFQLGKYKSGLIAVERQKRIYPWQILARRTLGIYRDKNMVGLEKYYDSLLRGHDGKRMVRFIAGGAAIPISNDADAVESKPGLDLVTTLDSYIQDLTEKSLLYQMQSNLAEEGCAIVMETKTGRIKALANLMYNKQDGTYDEVKNFALTKCEPGSTFKLITLMSLLEQGYVNLNTKIDLEGGKFTFNNRTVHDTEGHDEKGPISVKDAFEMSSNVAFAKLAVQFLLNNPKQYFQMLSQFNIDTLTGIDLIGESSPLLVRLKNRFYNPNTIPWMAFGYGVELSPLQMLTFYNAIANQGKMMKPTLQYGVMQEGKLIKINQPTVIKESICRPDVIRSVQEALMGVCENGTAKKVFIHFPFKVAGKTGTTRVANGRNGYIDNQYFSSFVGYFPAQNPTYTCMVWIKNKQGTKDFYGAQNAAPVFKRIALKLYLMNKLSNIPNQEIQETDSTAPEWMFNKTIAIKNLTESRSQNIEKILNSTDNHIPELKNFSVKDAILVCEKLGLNVRIVGQGKLVSQSIATNQYVAPGQHITLIFN